MATDVTTLLIQRIQSKLSSADVSSLASNSDFLSQITGLVGTAANYAQILGTVEGPAAQIVATGIAGGAAKATFDAAGQASALGATVATAGIGAGIVLIFSFVLSILYSKDSSGSAESQAIQQISQQLGQLSADFTDVGLGTYWQTKIDQMMNLWSSPQGGLGIDLDNLANEGTAGIDVRNDVSKFHDHALAFVNNFLPWTPGADIFWERPLVQSQVFTAEGVQYPVWAWSPHADSIWGDRSAVGWYGSLPQPESGPPLGGSSNQMVLDPTSMLPFLLLGLQSYLTIEMLVNVIDPSQPVFDQFVKQFSGDLQGYVRFIYSQYHLAVNGLVKSDLPKTVDIFGFLSFTLIRSSYDYTDMADQLWGNSSRPAHTPTPSAGHVWNGVYGVVDEYPQYGAYQPSPPVPVPYASPSYIIDVISTDTLVHNWTVAYIFRYPYLYDYVASWVGTWVQARLTLARMARWKAIYLVKGCDQVWSALHRLQFLAKPSAPIVPPLLTLDQDGTIADGNWSVRELLSLLDTGEFLGQAEFQVSLDPSGNTWGDSLYALLVVLNIVANGNWAGPTTQQSLTPPMNRPLSFRSLLSAAAD